MFSCISSRAILPVAFSVTGFVIACSVLLYTFIKQDLIRGEIEHAADLTDTVIKSTNYAMLKDDRETLSNIINNIGEQHQVEHVRIFNKKGLIMFSRDSEELNRFIDKTAAGCNECHSGPVPKRSLGTMAQARQFTNKAGNDVLAITAPIYNDPKCSNTACHFHDPGQSLLGTLDLGVSQARLFQTLGQLQNRMITFSAMILVLTVGVVCALLHRQVFLPIRRLVDFTEDQMDDSLINEFPEIKGEIAQLADSFHKMKSRVRELEEKLKNGNGDRSTPDSLL